MWWVVFPSIVGVLVVYACILSWLHFLCKGDLDVNKTTTLLLAVSQFSDGVLQILYIPFDFLFALFTRVRASTFGIFILLAWSIAFTYDSGNILQFLDEAYVTFVAVVWRGMLADVLWVARFVYETVVPVSNAVIILVQQMAYGLFDMIWRCDINTQNNAVHVVGGLPLFVGDFGASVVDFSQGSVLQNRLNTTLAWGRLQESAASLALVGTCTCPDVAPVFKNLAVWLNSSYIRDGLSSLTYFPVCVLQTVFNNTAPRPCFLEASQAVHSGGRFADDAVNLFVNTTTLPGKLPPVFFGTFLARMVQFALSFVGSAADVAYGDRLGAFTDPFSQLYAASDALGRSTQWMLRSPFETMPEAEVLSCPWYDLSHVADPQKCSCVHTALHNTASGYCQSSGEMLCSPGYHTVSQHNPASHCVSKTLPCGLGGVRTAAQQGRCECRQLGTSIDVTTGLCKQGFGDAVVAARPGCNSKPAAAPVRAPACVASAVFRAGVLVAHVFVSFIERVASGANVFETLKAVDGAWRPRSSYEYYTCESLKADFNGTTNPALYKCNITATYTKAVLCDTPGTCVYNPVGSAPTMQLAYAELDRAAFYLGVASRLHLTVGALVSTGLRAGVELLRIATHVLVSLEDIVSSYKDPLSNFWVHNMGFQWGPAWTGETTPYPGDATLANALQFPGAQFVLNPNSTSAQVRKWLDEQFREKQLQKLSNNYSNQMRLTASRDRTPEGQYSAIATRQACMFQLTYSTKQGAGFGYYLQDPNQDAVVSTNFSEPLSQQYLWCESMLFEHAFVRGTEFGYALKNVFALLQTNLGPLSALDQHVSDSACFDSDNRFVIISRTSLSITFPCANSDQCTNLDMTNPLWLDEGGQSWCTIYGWTSMPCNVGSAFREAADAGSQLGRQAATNMMAVLGVHPSAIDIVVLGQMCRLQQVAGEVISALSVLLTGFQGANYKSVQILQKSLATAGFVAMDVYGNLFALIPSVAHDFGKSVFNLLIGLQSKLGIDSDMTAEDYDFMSNGAQINIMTLELLVNSLTDPQVAHDLGNTVAFYMITMFNQAIVRYYEAAQAVSAIMKELGDPLGTALGAFTEDVTDITVMFLKYIEMPAFNLIVTLTKAIAALVSLLMNPSAADAQKLVATLINAAWTLVVDNFVKAILGDIEIGLLAYETVIAMIFAVITKSIATTSPGFGKVLTMLLKDGCEAMNGFFKGVNTAIGVLNGLTSLFSSKAKIPEAPKLTCQIFTGNKPNVNRRLQEVPEFTLSDLDWRGNTLCTQVAEDAIATNMTALSGTMRWCVQNRVWAAMLSVYLPVLPATFFDDWLQPAHYGFELARSSMVYFLHGLQNLTEPQRHMALWVESHLPRLEVDPSWANLTHPHLVSVKQRWQGLIAAENATTEVSGVVPSWNPDFEWFGAENYGAAAPAPAPACTTKYCINCLLIATFMDTLVNVSTYSSNFYLNHYLDTRQGFKDYFANKGTPQRSKAVKRDAGVKYASDYSAQDAHAINNAVNDWWAAISAGNWNFIGSAFRGFFTKPPDQPVPLFKHSLWYYAEWFTGRCDVESLFVVRTGHVWHALMSVGIGMLVWAVVHAVVPWIPIPLFWATVSAAFVYMALAYGYQPRCLPALPASLVADLQNWVYSKSLPDCFCPWVRSLSPGACPTRCVAGYTAPAYRNCPERALGVLWAPMFLLRWQLPSVFVQLAWAYTGAELANMVEDAQLHLVPSALDRACFWAQSPNVLLVLFGFFALVSAVPRVITRLFSTIKSIGFGAQYLVQAIANEIEYDFQELKDKNA